MEAHPDKALKTPETHHLSHSVRQINTAERGEKEGKKKNNSQDGDRAMKRGQTWRERQRGSVEGASQSQWKHIVPVSHIQASPTADGPCSQVLSQLITLRETTPHSQEFTAKCNNYFADLGDYCIMGAYSHIQSPVTVTPSQNCQFNHN